MVDHHTDEKDQKTSLLHTVTSRSVSFSFGPVYAPFPLVLFVRLQGRPKHKSWGLNH